MIKLMIAIKRKPGLTHEQFREHLSSLHAQLVLACPATRKYVRKYVQSYTLPSSAPGQGKAFDGASELWFDTTEDMDRFFADPDYLADVRPDEGRFSDLDETAFFVTEERQIV